MSNYNSEWGHIDFTKTGYNDFVRAYRKNHNAVFNAIFEWALACHQSLSTIKGRGALAKQLKQFDLKIRDAVITPFGYADRVDIDFFTSEMIKDEMFRGQGGKLTKPRKSALSLLNNKQTSFGVTVNYNASLSFSLEYLRIEWSVDENNRAVEDANSATIHTAFSLTLRKYKWRRKEGGCFYYTDEYIQDAARENGHGDSTSTSCYFGPLGEDTRKREHEALFNSVSRRRRRRA
jgi:hypothetical protein